MELKCSSGTITRFIIKLLIVPYGIEIEALGLTFEQALALNRTLWN